MIKKSAGILLYRQMNGNMEVFLVHPGGPFFVKKDSGAWSIPKGEFLDGEEPLLAAKREFFEETGVALEGKFTSLTPLRQKSGKMVYAWAIEGDLDEKQLKSNMFQIEWPPKSGSIKQFPEIDRGAWFSPEIARQKIIPAQAVLIDELISWIIL